MDYRKLFERRLRPLLIRQYEHRGIGPHFAFEIEKLDRRGRVTYRERLHNLTHDAGEEYYVKLKNGDLTVLTNYYLGLDARLAGNILEADDLAALVSEPAGLGGYARIALASSNGVAQQVGGDWEIAWPQQTFSATANWGTMKNTFVADQLSATTGDRLIASAPMSQDQTINNGESLNVTPKISEKEPA